MLYVRQSLLLLRVSRKALAFFEKRNHEALNLVKEAQDAATEEEPHVTPDVRDEAVYIVDEVLFLLDVGCFSHRYVEPKIDLSVLRCLLRGRLRDLRHPDLEPVLLAGREAAGHLVDR